MICIFCEVDFEDLERHLRDRHAKSRCWRLFTSAYKGYAAVCHRCGFELGGRTVQHALEHAAVCDPEATESDPEMERYKRARKRSRKEAS